MTDNTTIALLKKDLDYLKQGIGEIKEQLQCQGKNYVSKLEFDMVNCDQNKRIDRVEKLVYGAIALTLTSIGKALMDLIIISKASQ